MKSYNDYSIELQGRTGVEVATTCPQCSHMRKKKNTKCLSVNTEKGVWFCHHCSWVGSLKFGIENKPIKRMSYIRPVYSVPDKVPDNMQEWFKNRGISIDSIQKYGISIQSVYMPTTESETACIAFPYFRDGEVVNIKYRSRSKDFRQIAGAEKCLYGIDDIKGETWAVFVEGEIDKLSFAEAGIYNVVSVPDGAPPPNSKSTDMKFEYLENCKNYVDSLEKIIMAVDSDPAGKQLEKELTRRLGIERCFKAVMPEDCKDANDVLVKYGAEELRSLLADAKPYPLEGVLSPIDVIFDVAALYQDGVTAGLSTGWVNLDRLYTVRQGEMTVVTGVPSHGKSQFLDALMVNLAQEENWRFAVCSPENTPVERHIAKLIELYSGWPFHEGYNRRLPSDELQACMEWLNEHFVFIVPEEAMSIQALLEIAKKLVSRNGINGLVIDPWNEFDHTRPAGISETEHVSICLGGIRRFARHNKVKTWVVAHPQKLYRTADGTYPVPTPYDISGSAHFRNKADNNITIWRNEQGIDREVKVYIQKIRFREVGRVGEVSLYWNPVNGRYGEVDSYARV